MEKFPRFGNKKSADNPEKPHDPVEAPPPLLKEAVDSIVESILSQKSFESPELYEKLGVREFKRYLPTTGDLMYKYVWKRLPPIARGFFGLENGAQAQITRDPKSVDEMLFVTKAVELTHYAMLAVFSYFMYEQFNAGSLSGLAMATTTNALVNVYPIMLQRYNRIRLTHLKGKMRGKSDADVKEV